MIENQYEKRKASNHSHFIFSENESLFISSNFFAITGWDVIQTGNPEVYNGISCSVVRESFIKNI